MRILVFRGGAIGDFILTLPALQALRRRWPDAYLEVVGYPHIATLAVAGGIADRVESLDKAAFARFFAMRADLEPDLCRTIRSFDLVVSYLFDPDSVFRNNLLRAGARHVLYGTPMVGQGHASEHFLKPLQSLALYDDGLVPELIFGEEMREQGHAWLRQRNWADVVVLHPGSGSPTKNWPLKNFVEVAGYIRSRRLGLPVFIAGEADAAVLADLQKEEPDAPVIRGVSLLDLAGILVNCRGYVGNDSGITHLAAAVGIPVCALFGPSDAACWGPRGPRVRILAAPDGRIEQITPEEVFPLLPV